MKKHLFPRLTIAVLTIVILISSVDPAAWAQGVFSGEFAGTEYYTVTFAVPELSETDPAEKTVLLVRAGSPIYEFPDAPIRDGRVFMGWYTNEGVANVPFYPYEDLELTARYSTNTLTFTTPEGSAFSASGALPEDAQLYAFLETGDEAKKSFDTWFDRTSGELVKGSASAAVPVVLEMYDISIASADGDEWQPGGQDVRVSVKLSESFPADVYDHFCLLHLRSDGVVEQVANFSPEIRDDQLEGFSFLADSFSIYALAGYQLEKIIEASDGSTYRISLMFEEDALLPEGADLQVVELRDDVFADYIGRAASIMSKAGFEYARVFDISIVDGEGLEFQPSAPVKVTVELLDAVNTWDQFSVVHFSEASSEAEQLTAKTKGNKVSFTTDGFSAYAIVQGPEALPLGWTKLSSLEELNALGSEGLYIGHTDGYYFTDGITIISSTRTGITKTKPAESVPNPSTAALYYFEPAGDGKYYVYCKDGSGVKYVYNNQNNSLNFSASAETAFTVKVSDGKFTLNSGSWYWNMQGGASGASFASYNNANDANNKMYIWHYVQSTGDPYKLDGKQYGLMNWNGSVAGKALMASSQAAGTLDSLALIVMSEQNNNDDKLFVPNDSEITKWTFHWVSDDCYHLTANVAGSTKYLRINGTDGLSLVSEPDDSCRLHVIPGSGAHNGQICLRTDGATLTFSGTVEGGFAVNGNVGNEWLYFVNDSELTSAYFLTYSAQKVSVSDTERVTNGSQIIIYCRIWNEAKERYELFALDSDGSLVPCFESGDSIQWVGHRLNSLLWNFVEYYNEGTSTPTYYYDLFNQYSQKFLAPAKGEQVLSGNPIYLNMNGRRNGTYYTTVAAWDDHEYDFSFLKADTGRVTSIPYTQVENYSDRVQFYFAIMEDVSVNDELHTVPTVDHQQYGITMKLKNFSSRSVMSNFLGNDLGGAVYYTQPNLLSTNLGEDGYPAAAGGSLGMLFGGAKEVNHLFIKSIYSSGGYFEYDSTQNFASLRGSDFVVYKELGSYDTASERNTLKHGQFFPYNDLQAGKFASIHRQNLYSATGSELPESDPRKYELLYNIQNADCYFGMELEASFEQTPNGKDAWGHDIIYEFTGDDDFWLYVDGELIIDLGGIHSALAGSVNYRTGTVKVNGTSTTLKNLFYQNYLRRNHTPAEAQEYVDGIFELNSEGNYVFKDGTSHTMRIFYMERGAGASNLYMRFNLATIKPGTVLLSKELSGVDSSESVLAEFPYQVWYKTSGDPTEKLLWTDRPIACVKYKDTEKAVPSIKTYTVDGIVYQDVFILKPGETAEVILPEGTETYRIVECGVNTDIFDSVTVNRQPVTGTAAGDDSSRQDFGIEYESPDNRARVSYVNHVDPDALRTLTVSKHLYREDGETRITPEEDSTTFNFRLFFGTETGELNSANMHVYHVKDPDGYYCTWSSAQQAFIPTGFRDYSLMTVDQKHETSFVTSINGSVSKIPVDYTVEFRAVLAGTRFRLEERKDEIPDGYSLQKYLLNGVDAGSVPPEDTVDAGQDYHVEVCNLKGWGLRVRKLWSDTEFMADRAPAYFAVYTENGGTESLVDGTIRLLKQNEETLYWYFLPLPVDVPFNQYVIREVMVSDPTVDNEGVVTAYQSVTPIPNEGTLDIEGRQKGESNTSEFHYTVLYEKGVVSSESNVRVDIVTNNRPGIVLRKENWTGEALPGAIFDLNDSDGTLIGTFASDEDGQITVAFLRDDVDYTLTETFAPQGYHGPEESMVVRLSNGTVSVSGVDQDYYSLIQGEGLTPTLTIKNRPYSFEVVKRDANTDLQPMSGVKFALHRQITVGEVTQFDLNPMEGYEELITDEKGIVPKLDNTLPAGVYELREIEVPEGYLPPDSHVRFIVSPTGAVTSFTDGNGNEIHPIEIIDDESVFLYQMTIENTKVTSISITKTVTGNMGDIKLPFPFSVTINGVEYAGTYTVGGISYAASAENPIALKSGQTAVIRDIPFGANVTVTEIGEEAEAYETTASVTPGQDQSPEGDRSVTFVVEGNDSVSFVNNSDLIIQTGIALDAKPFTVLFLLSLCGAAWLFLNRKALR